MFLAPVPPMGHGTLLSPRNSGRNARSCLSLDSTAEAIEFSMVECMVHNDHGFFRADVGR